MGDLGQNAPPRTAFVLDDEVQVGTVVCKMLQLIGIEGKHFINPIQFLAELKLSAPNLVVLDLALGQSDAVEIIRKLEVVAFKGDVMLISGRDEGTLAEIERIGRARGLSMLPSLKKPFRSTDLKARLNAPSGPKSPASNDMRAASNPAPAGPRIDLKEALQKNLLEVWYQPKIDLKSLAVCGAEALIRARHPKGDIIQPVDLLPPTGDPLYKPLSVFVIRRAMADWEQFTEQGHSLKLAINVPASILNAPGFVDVIRQMIPRDPRFPGLFIEITEDEIIRDPEWIHEVATQLRLYNAWISIDDFGSAYASLSRLKELPFRELKLDRSFVSNCSADALKRGLCQSVVDLGRCFGASVCAEGVETAADLRCLIDMGFDTAQGFLFAKPLPAKAFLEFLSARPSVSKAIPGPSEDKSSLSATA